MDRQLDELSRIIASAKKDAEEGRDAFIHSLVERLKVWIRFYEPRAGHVSGNEASEILRRVQTWAGGEAEALSWYRSQPIAAFGDRTAESLVASGHATALRDYLDSIAVGGFA